MADIKTRDIVKGTIKTLDKSAIAADRMRSAYAKTKERAEEAQYASENNASEYASDRIESTVDRTTHEVVYQADKQGRKGVKTTKENISKAKEQIRQFKEKRAATNVYGNTKTVRTAKEPNLRQLSPQQVL